jgi:hypothetical protein
VLYSQIPVALLKGGCVLRIWVPYVYKLSEALQPISNLTDGAKLSDVRYQLYFAHSTLSEFLYQSVWGLTLRVCTAPGKDLLDALQAAYSKNDGDDTAINWFDLFNLNQKLTAFKTVLEAELQIAATYLVTPRRGYDINTLLANAEVIFPAELCQKIPEILFDLREAGKCLAFELGTAAGFHLLRSLETVICLYWNVVMNGASLPDNRNLGNYINRMEAAGKGDGKVLTALRQIKDHHRNSLMHPEETLDLDSAIALLGIVQSAIVAMLPTIPPRPTVAPAPDFPELPDAV